MEEHRVAIVTGGTRGIGAAISLRLAETGYSILAVYHSNKQVADEFLRQLQTVSKQSRVFCADVGDQESVNNLIEYTVGWYGRIDVLINNAGMFDFQFMEEMEESFISTILNINFVSQLRMIKACLPYLKESDQARIINASSISSSIADVGLVGYGASKAAVDMMTKIAAAELAKYQITVNAYAPGIIHTDLTDTMIKERGEIQKRQIPLLRFGSGQEVAALVSFLCTKEAGYITGEVIGVDGGMMKVQNPYRMYTE